jgi:hypothetical protein
MTPSIVAKVVVMIFRISDSWVNRGIGAPSSRYPAECPHPLRRLRSGWKRGSPNRPLKKAGLMAKGLMADGKSGAC